MFYNKFENNLYNKIVRKSLFEKGNLIYNDNRNINRKYVMNYCEIKKQHIKLYKYTDNILNIYQEAKYGEFYKLTDNYSNCVKRYFTNEKIPQYLCVKKQKGCINCFKSTEKNLKLINLYDLENITKLYDLITKHNNIEYKKIILLKSLFVELINNFENTKPNYFEKNIGLYKNTKLEENNKINIKFCIKNNKLFDTFSRFLNKYYDGFIIPQHKSINCDNDMYREEVILFNDSCVIERDANNKFDVDNWDDVNFNSNYIFNSKCFENINMEDYNYYYKKEYTINYDPEKSYFSLYLQDVNHFNRLNLLDNISSIIVYLNNICEKFNTKICILYNFNTNIFSDTIFFDEWNNLINKNKFTSIKKIKNIMILSKMKFEDILYNKEFNFIDKFKILLNGENTNIYFNEKKEIYLQMSGELIDIKCEKIINNKIGKDGFIFHD